MLAFIAIAANTKHNKNGQIITSVPLAYSRCVQWAGAVSVILPPAQDEQTVALMLSRVDGLILPGGHDMDHDVRFDPGSRLYLLFGQSIRINSRHHQSIDAPGRGLRITAWAPDGVVEGAEHESLPIDLVQWHPELLMHKNNDMLPLFNKFIRNCQDRLSASKID